MITSLDPKRIEIARHIMEARKLATEIDDEMLDHLLEMALNENLGHDASTRIAIVERLLDPKI